MIAGRKKLLLATKNPAKVSEYKLILNNFPIEIVSLKDLNIEEEVEEDGKTFEENAIKKVKFYSKLTGLPALADDGGIEIDCLGGEPGIKSRRWLGRVSSDEELIEITMKKMEGVPSEKRSAQLRMVIAVAIPGDPRIYTFEGKTRGMITEKPSLARYPGFPFRSIFYLPEINKIWGELTKEEEAEISHRKTAIIENKEILQKLLC